MREPHHPPREELELPSILHALSDPARLEIVRRLAAGSEEWSCGRFELGLSKATLSHHFRVLREAGVVRTRPDGRKRLLSLRNEDLNSRFPGLLEAVLADDHAQPLPPVLAAAGAAASGNGARQPTGSARRPSAAGGLMEIGLYTFAELPVGAGEPRSRPEQRMRNLLEEVELADQVGLDVFGVGEHHRPDFAVSSPAVVLAAIAARTERIRLTSAVTVLSSDDPVRVFQDFATLDLLSGGRAEIMVGRGSFIESFPLFGYDLDDYDELFAEKLELLLELRESERVTWSGRHRAALEDAGVYPRPLQDPLPIWVAVGGTPHVVVRAGSARAAAGAGDHRRRAGALRAAGRALPRDGARGRATTRAALPVGHQLAHLRGGHAPSRRRDEFFPAYAGMMNRIGRERGWSPMTREQFDVPALAARRAGGRAARRRWSRRSSSSTSCSATSASSRRSASGTCRTHRSCGRSSCSAPRWPPPCARRSQRRERGARPRRPEPRRWALQWVAWGSNPDLTD